MEKMEKKDKFIIRALGGIERVGNRLPDPSTIFIVLALLVVVVSGVCSYFGVSAVHPGTGETIQVVNLMSVSGFRRMWSSMVTNFSSFAPFGMVMVAIIGSGVAEKTGFLSVLMRRMLGNAPRAVVTYAIICCCFLIHLAGDSGFIIMPPLAAIVFLGMGRHPLLGMFTAYAAVAGGLCANFIICLPDVLAFSFTQPAAQMVDPNYVGSPTINYYFLLVSCFLLAAVGTFMTEKVIAPRFQKEDLSQFKSDESLEILPEQRKGLRAAGIAALIVVVALVAMCLGERPILGDPETGSIFSAASPFMTGIITLAVVLLFVPSAVYGFVSKQLKSERDLYGCIIDAFKDMAPYILLCFFCSQFTSYFTWSNLGQILAIKGSEFLASINMKGLPLLLCIILLSCIINMFIGSASAKWAILAPIFVPMLMLMGFDPAATQIAYRIGDAITNPLSPLFSYFPLILGFARRYKKDTGFGTIVANMIPFSAAFTIMWVIQLTVWYVLDLPLGPGGVFHYLPY